MKYVPLISSGTHGPLGVLHLPRLWQKISLEAKGLLAEGYPAVGNGFDMMVIEGLGLEKDAVVEFIKSSTPTYPQFEQWIKEQPGAKIDAGSVVALNTSIRDYHHDDETRGSILGAAGIPDDQVAPKDAVTLNNLDDWTEFHQSVLA